MAHAWPRSPRPYARWWWFNQPLDLDVIRRQLAWIEANGFGGVEIAWIYPKKRAFGFGPDWLSAEWSEIVVETKRECDRLGLGCDFTYGSLWPFGGSFLKDPEHQAQDFFGPAGRDLDHSWEVLPVPILNHLSEMALRFYASRMTPALAEALKGSTSALFCDSWEVPSSRLWSSGLWDVFRERFGYDLRPFAEADFEDAADARYDHLKFVGERATAEFFRPFAAICREAGAVSRVQCHGSPTDLLDAYGAVDVPESEALLFEPTFSRVPASAAALGGKPVVSCETFTCLYGFPRFEMGFERPADLKLLADAVFAQGVNQVVWHGIPYFDPEDVAHGERFFATTHVGPDSGFSYLLPEFNAYLARVSERLQRGRTLTSLAVYLPVEDGRMGGRIPPAERTPAAQWRWEMRDVVPPEETMGHHPLWVGASALRSADVRDGRLYVGDAEFSALYAGVEWMEEDSLREILRQARLGLPVALVRRPRQPGRMKTRDYDERILPELLALPNVKGSFAELRLAPFLEGKELPPYWARVEGETLTLFLAHPAAKDVRYPMEAGQAERSAGKRRLKLTIRHGAARKSFVASFRPGESLLYEFDGHRLRRVDLDFLPGPDSEGGRWSRLFGKPEKT